MKHLSTIEPLPLLNTEKQQFFIKRDDRLPHGGSKARKYTTLLPAILASGHKKALLKGGKNSNHIHYFSKLLQENGIEIGEEGFVVEEGGSQEESLAGAASLAHEIPNEFDHILIDAGTGMMAAALLNGVSAHVHVLQLAPLDFRKKYEAWFGPFPEERCTLHLPAKWRSFGSFTKPLLRFIVQFTAQTGIPLDPIYSGKLLYFTPQITQNLKGKILIIHQGVSPKSFLYKV